MRLTFSFSRTSDSEAESGELVEVVLRLVEGGSCSGQQALVIRIAAHELASLVGDDHLILELARAGWLDARKRS